jgi:pyruvate carboxylase
MAQINAGTVEFMVEPNGNYYFLEVNPRIQARDRQRLIAAALTQSVSRCHG